MIYYIKHLSIRVREDDDMGIFYEENEPECYDWKDGKIARLIIKKSPYRSAGWMEVNDSEVGDLFIINHYRWIKL